MQKPRKIRAERETWGDFNLPSRVKATGDAISSVLALVHWLLLSANFVRFKLAFMADHPNPCEICAQIAQIEAKTHPRFIAELPTGYAVLGASQFFRGYTVFLCKTPAPDLENLPREARFQFLREMALVSEAVAAIIKPHKMNVESLGNVVPHLHFHLFPRQLSEKEAQKPVWLCAPEGENAEKHVFDAARDENLRLEIRAKLEQLTF